VGRPGDYLLAVAIPPEPRKKPGTNRAAWRDMGARRTSSNSAVLLRMVRQLRLDGEIEPLITLATTSAALVDAVCADDSDVAVYVRAACVRAHGGLLEKLAARVPPSKDPEDPWEKIARQLDPHADDAQLYP
jgi:hypothetical protein